MIRLFGHKKILCDGVSRRDLLQIGGLGALGLGLTDWFHVTQAQARPADAGASFGKAKSCILLYLYGGHPQHETFDPKPDAPREVQGEMQAISTSVPGVFFGEGLPGTARIMDRVTVVRSMTHPYPVHGFAYAVTGRPTYDPSIEFAPLHSTAWPYVGSVVDYIESKREGVTPLVPRNVGLPWRSGTKCDRGAFAGPYGGFLGAQYNPIWTDFDGKGTRVVPKLNDKQTMDVYDPWGGCAPTGKFLFSNSSELPAGIPQPRFDARRSLLQQFDAVRGQLRAHADITTYARHQQRAYDLLTSQELRAAIDVHREPQAIREHYGMTLFGQSALVARRLVEAGGKFVSVIWDAFGPFTGCAWDTHYNHYERLQQYLLPTLDQTLPALILDLEQRGMLEETLVLCISEHGRTPKVRTDRVNGGRDHWSRVYSILAAGGGIASGRIVGSSDAHAAEVNDTPISPKDLLATTYHLLGIDPNTTIPDRLDRPTPIAGSGVLRTEMLG